MTGNREVITGNDFKRMIAGAYSAFLLEYENINALNADSLMDEKCRYTYFTYNWCSCDVSS